MHSIQLWKNAKRPNYVINTDRMFPYSEVPFLGQYHLVKIPLQPADQIDHVDYWGEGKIETKQGNSGFSNCFNVNHVFQLVSNGPDKDRKIPNRVPVVSYTNCDTSAYIRDNSILTVTAMGSPINSSCASDIARMVNKDAGKVILYGFDTNSADVRNITAELENNSLYHYSDYKLPTDFQGLTLFDNHIAFVSVTFLKDEIYKLVINGSYDDAVMLTKKLDSNQNGGAINDVVLKLLKSNSTGNFKLMSFAYILWNNGAENIVKIHFPAPFKLILGKEKVAIVNHGYDQALKLDANEVDDGRLAWGHNGDKTSNRLSWEFVPVWSNNDVTFKLYNVDRDMYLKLDVTVDNTGDRKAFGSKSSEEDRYYVEPYMKDGTLLFFIINYQYHQGLKLGIDVDSHGDRLLWGHHGDIYAGEERFKWNIMAWTSS